MYALDILLRVALDILLRAAITWASEGFGLLKKAKTVQSLFMSLAQLMGARTTKSAFKG